MKIILIKSKLKGFLIQAAVANPWRLFRTWILEITLLITLPNSSFLPSLPPKGGSGSARDQVYYENSALVSKKRFCSSFWEARSTSSHTEQIKTKKWEREWVFLTAGGGKKDKILFYAFMKLFQHWLRKLGVLLLDRSLLKYSSKINSASPY